MFDITYPQKKKKKIQDGIQCPESPYTKSRLVNDWGKERAHTHFVPK